MRRGIVTAFVAGLVALSGWGAGLPAPYAETPGVKAYPGADVLVLSDARTVTLAADGRVTQTVVRVEKILTFQGMDLAGDPKVSFNSQTQELRDYRLRTLTADGEVREARANSFNEMTPYELERAPAYTAWREMVMTKVGLDVGCVVESQWTVADKTPWRRFYDGDFLFAEPPPSLERTVAVTVPGGTALHYAFFNGTAEPVVRADGTGTTYTWRLRDGAALPVGRAREEELWAAPRLLVTTCPDWATANKVFGPLVDAAVAAGSPKIAQKADALVKGAVTEFQKALALQRYVAEAINTVEWPLSDFGYAPRTAAQVFDSGYGHALDKAVLLCAMLQRVGIWAAPAACRPAPQGLPDPGAVPCMAQMSRIIVHSKVDGATLWFDPVAPLAESSQRNFRDFKGLPLTAGFGELHTMPALEAPDRLLADLRATLASNFSYEGEGTLELDGAYSPFYGWQGSAEALKSGVEEYLGGILPGAELTAHSVALLSPARTRVALKFKGQIPEEPKGPRLLKTGLPAGSLLARLPQMHRSVRELPLLLGWPGEETVTLALALPKNLFPTYLPEEIQVTGEAGSGSQRWTTADGALRMSLEIRIPSRVIGPKTYPALRELWGRLTAPPARTVLF